MSCKSFGVIVLVLASAHALLAQEPAPALVDEAADAAPASRLWVGAEYLLWWVKNGPVPGPLVTSGPVTATTGALGAPGTVVLFGNADINYKAHSGGRFTLGSWFDDRQAFGFELSGLILETHTIHFTQNSDKSGGPVVARPFFNTLTDTEDAEVLTAPGNFFGGIDVFTDSRFWSAEGNFVGNLLRGTAGSVDVLVGFRYLGLDESLRLSQSSTVLPGGTPPPAPPGFLGVPVPPPDILSLTDRFLTRDEFFGGQLGLRGTWRFGRFSLEGTGKVGLGDTKQWVNMAGDTELTGTTGRIAVANAGLFTSGGNIGLYSRDRLTFISEAGCRLGYAISEGWSAHVGAALIYWDDVARPGAQISMVLNPQVLPSNPAFGPVTTAPDPRRRFASSDYWAAGLTLGLTYRY